MTRKKIGVRELRKDLPGVLEEVQHTGQGVVVMKHKEEVAALVPVGTLPISPLPRIIALASLKGGVGKTTVTMHLAAVLADEGHNVVVLDADEEKSAYRWAEEASTSHPLNFKVMQANRDSLMRQARELEKAGHVVVIDTPPNNREILRSAASVADLVLVPLLPTGMDVDRMATTLILLNDIEAIRPNFAYALLINRYDARKRLARETQEEIKNLPRLETYIAALTVYEGAFGKQPTALDAPRAIWQEIKQTFGVA